MQQPNSRQNSQNSLQLAGKRGKPEDRSPDNLETKKNKEGEASRIIIAGQSPINYDMSEIVDTITANITANIQPLIIREVQLAFDNIITRLDFIESKLKEFDSYTVKKNVERISFLEDKVDNL